MASSTCCYAREVLQALKNDESCNIVLRGSDQEVAMPDVKAHKHILAGASSHLKDAFSSVGYVDSTTAVYTLHAVDHAALMRVVDYIYGFCIVYNTDDKMALEEIKLVLIGADYLNMHRLVAECQRLLIKTAGKVRSGRSGDVAATFLGLWLFGRQFRCEKLTRVASHNIHFKFDYYRNNNLFLQADSEDVLQLVKQGSAAAKTVYPRSVHVWHADICFAAVAWLGYDSTVVYDLDGMQHATDILDDISKLSASTVGAARRVFIPKILAAMPTSTLVSSTLRELLKFKFLGDDYMQTITAALQKRANDEDIAMQVDDDIIIV